MASTLPLHESPVPRKELNTNGGLITDHSLPSSSNGSPFTHQQNHHHPIIPNNNGSTSYESEKQQQQYSSHSQPPQTHHRKFANPAPLGLSAFALTTFVLSLVNLRTRRVNEPNIVVALAFAYGGLVQLLAGMWEMAVGNTFGATALSSYGGFWLSFAIILTPGGFQIVESLGGESKEFHDSFGFFLMGWFIFTTLLLLVTLRSTIAFFLLFFFLDLAFLFLGIGYLHPYSNNKVREPVIKAGGFFGLLAAFMAWYNALAGMADSSNSFFVAPLGPFPWSEQGRERKKAAKDTV